MKKFLNYTEEEVLEAVKQDSDALKLVREQTEAVCLEAVKQNGYALQFVREQTESVCLEAVKESGYAIKYVEKYYKSVADITDDADYKALANTDKDKDLDTSKVCDYRKCFCHSGYWKPLHMMLKEDPDFARWYEANKIEVAVPTPQPHETVEDKFVTDEDGKKYKLVEVDNE